MYAIGTVIFGIPLTLEVFEVMNELEQDPASSWNEDDDGCCGFTMQYSGATDCNPGYCGVKLTEFDECTDRLRLSDLTSPPTEEQRQEALQKIAALDPRLREAALEPDIYIIWSTS